MIPFPEGNERARNRRIALIESFEPKAIVPRDPSPARKSFGPYAGPLLRREEAPSVRES